MNISELINKLEEVKKEHGDIDVMLNSERLYAESIKYVEVCDRLVALTKYVELS